MSRIKGAKNVYSSWLYDRNVVPTGVVTTRSLFFTTPRANADPEKHLSEKGSADTNLDVGGQLTGVNSFRIESMEALINTKTDEDREKLRRASFCLVINSCPIPDPLPLEVLMNRRLEFGENGLVTMDPGDVFSVSVEYVGGISPEQPIDILFILWGSRCKPVMDDDNIDEEIIKKAAKKVGREKKVRSR